MDPQVSSAGPPAGGYYRAWHADGPGQRPQQVLRAPRNGGSGCPDRRAGRADLRLLTPITRDRALITVDVSPDPTTRIGHDRGPVRLRVGELGWADVQGREQPGVLLQVDP